MVSGDYGRVTITSSKHYAQRNTVELTAANTVDDFSDHNFHLPCQSLL